MEQKNKLFRVIILTVSTAIIIFTIYSLFSKSQNKKDLMIGAERHNKQSSSADMTLGSKQKKPQSSTAQSNREFEEDVNPEANSKPAISEEEKAYRLELFEKTDKVFFDLAPRLLEEMLQEETRDKSWKEAVLAKIGNFIGDPRIEGSQIKNVDCRKTLSIVTVILPDEKQVRHFRHLWAMVGPSGDNFGRHEKIEMGKIEVTVYLNRTAEAMPFIKLRERMASIMDKEEKSGS